MDGRIRVKTARIDADVTQKKAAEALGISRWTYGKLEKNPEKFTMEQARIIAELVNKRMNELKFLP